MRDEIRQLARKASEIDPQKLLLDYLQGDTNIAIYGAGNVGRNCVNFGVCKERDVKIICFLDKNADKKPEYYGYPVYKPDDSSLTADFRKNTVVVLALLLSEEGYIELENQLRELGYTKFVNAVNQLGAAISDYYYESEGRAFFTQDTNAILSAFDLMQDDHSRNVFFSIFKAYALSDYTLPTLSEGMIQYIDVQVPFRHNYRSFIDCGAFTGDTLESLVTYHKVEQYFGFEPDLSNFANLSQTCDRLKNNMGQGLCFPLGVGGKDEFLKFHGTGTSGRIDDRGGNIIQIVCLDSLFKGYNNLMIKMDIEGAEIAALKGAKKIITETKPDLAICVYHQVGDLWHIPNMLHEWVPEYKFYMRNHYANTMETVLYATTVP